jgi:hypothetical protein
LVLSAALPDSSEAEGPTLLVDFFLDDLREEDEGILVVKAAAGEDVFGFTIVGVTSERQG